MERDALRLYVAGPMRGYAGLNKGAFDRTATSLRARGFSVVNPAEMDADYDEDWDDSRKMEFMRDAMRRDCNAVCDCDGVYLLYGWEQSRGARAERALADAIGLKILFECHDSIRPYTMKDMTPCK